MSTTTDYPFDTTTTTTPYAKFISSAAANILANGAATTNGNDINTMDAHHHYQHNQITFEIPTHRDLEHIDALHSFNTLLKRIGNVAYDTISTAAATTVSAHPEHMNVAAGDIPLALDAAGHPITTEQISKSAVLNLAELKNGAVGGFERFFAGADIHSIINYLWIGVVTSLIILSVIFILFSCYFWRKFREWKKCNKDIRSQLNNEMLYPGGTIAACDSLIINGQSPEAAFYQIESPPCYTIATGLPTYDEALDHHHHHHHHQHYAFGMKFIYPNIAAVHHQQYHEQQHLQQQEQQAAAAAAATGINFSNWEKNEFNLIFKDKFQKQQQQAKTAKTQSTTMPSGMEAPPAYDVAASVALLAPNNNCNSNNNNNNNNSDDDGGNNYYNNNNVDEAQPSRGGCNAAATAPFSPAPIAAATTTTATPTPTPTMMLANEKLLEVVIA